MKYYFIIFFFLIIQLKTSAQVSFKNIPFNDCLHELHAEVYGDINGDGNIDILASGSNNIVFLLGKGNGEFTKAQHYCMDNSSVTHIEDLNNDRIMDVVIDRSGGFISVLIGVGNGIFKEEVKYFTGNNARAYYVKDINGDSFKDFISMNDKYISVLINNGAGGFTDQISYSSGGNGSIAYNMSDFDSDGIVDVLSASSTIYFMKGKSDGTFAKPLDLKISAGEKIIFSDINNDSIADFIKFGTYDYLGIFLGKGDGTFNPPKESNLIVKDKTTPFNSLLIKIEDINKDNIRDIVTYDVGFSGIIINLLKLDVNLSVVPIKVDIVKPYECYLEDFNNDGITDILYTTIKNNSNDSTYYLQGTRNGKFEKAKSFMFKFNNRRIEYIMHLTVADFNGDSKKDILVNGYETMTSADYNRDFVFLNSGSDLKFIKDKDFVQGKQFIVLQDFDKDGILDKLEAEIDFNKLNIYKGMGDGTFQYLRYVQCADKPISAVCEDFNNDGIIDVAVTILNSTKITVYFYNSILSNYSTSVQIENGLSINHFCSGDFNGDKKNDIATTSHYSDSVAIYLNLENKTFTSRKLFFAGKAPSNMAVADLNQDKIADISLTNPEINKISILYGLNAGNFKPPVYYGVGNYPNKIKISDLNNDGRLDLITTNLKSNNISILYGSANYDYAAMTNYYTGYNTTDVFLNRINQDTIIDIIVANHKSFSILLGNTKGTYEDPINTQVPLFANIAVGDLNGDKRSEILICNSEATTGTVVATQETPIYTLKNSYILQKVPMQHGIADFDKDGFKDFAIVYKGLDYISIRYGLGNEKFSDEMFFKVGKAPSVIVIGDINNDNYSDVIVYNTDSSEISVLLNDKKGKFQPHLKQKIVPTNISSMSLQDINNDGFIDLTLTHLAWSYIFLGDGFGKFNFKSSVSFTYPNKNIYFGDFNNDKNIDLITSIDGIFYGNGDGTFKSVVKVENIIGGNLIVLDFNKDSKLDLVKLSQNNKVELLLGSGKGTFSSVFKMNTSTEFIDNFYNSSCIAADINGDKILDLCLFTFKNNLIFLIGNSENTFQEVILPELLIGTPLFGYPNILISSADFNDDSKTDFMVSGLDFIDVSVHMLINTSSVITNMDNVKSKDINQQIFPNPNTGLFILKCGHLGPIEIFDAKGAKVWEGFKEDQTIIIDALLKNGLYLIKIKDQISKFSVQQ